MSNILSKVNLERMFPSFLYKRGLKYYQEGRVSDLLYDINHHVWTATVHGTEDYFVEINMQDIEKGTIRPYCDCPAFHAYDACKHIVATLCNVQARATNQQYPGNRVNYTLTDNFIRALTSVQRRSVSTEVLPEKIPLAIEYYCQITYDEKLILELKAGAKRCYVVKDIKRFLEDVLQEREHEFTKNFSYSPENHNVLQQDWEIFEVLYDAIRNREVYRDHFYSSESFDENRYMVIPPLIAKDLITKLITRNFRMGKVNHISNQLNMEADVLPFHYSLTKNNDDLLLHVESGKHLVYLKAYQMIYDDETFYFPSKEQIPIVEQMAQFRINGQELPISKEQADQFVSEVLPALKTIGSVEIADNVASEIIQVPLVAKLYLQLEEENIVGNLEYHYGNEKIDPFLQSQPKDVFIVRDVEKEQQIMQLIEHANFHYNGKQLYIEADEESLYDFLYHILPILDEYVALFLTADVRNMIVEQDTAPSTHVSMESSTNLLEIGFDMDGVDQDEVEHILNAVIEKKRYFRLASGGLLSLENEGFTSLQQLFQDLKVKKSDMHDGRIEMPAYRGMQIDELIETDKSYDASFRKLLRHLKSPEEQSYELPDTIQAKLRKYQLTGYQWFKSLSAYHLGGILADDMGLGKTLQTIAYLASEPSENPHLVVVPSSVVYNWKSEIEKFSPSMSVAVLTGNPVERHEKIVDSQEIDVWITSYATLRQDIALYREYTFQTLVLDEAQYIKNYATKTSKAIREIRASRKFALSGTPIENTIDELWAIFQVVLPGLMPNRKEFRQLEHDKIASLTKPFILRRLKSDVLKELPEKIESVSISELTKEQKELYVGYLHQLQRETTQSLKEQSFQKNRMKILAGLTRLRQLCCHPSLFIENYAGQSGKLNQLMDTIHTAIENGKRMLIFSQFTSMHELIATKLEDAGISYFYLHGQTPSQERVEMSERFNQGENSVFLISLKAGGTGLNLTGADTVILYDLWWNPAVEDQAAGRAHRFGQKNTVHVIRMITEGTIEEKIYELQQKKRKLIDQVIQPGETMLSSLSEDDIRELLSV